MNLPDTLRPVLSRVVSALIAAALAALARHGFELQLDEGTQGALSDVGVALILSVWGVVYAVVHKLLSAKTNPTDSAARSLAKVATGPMGDGQRTQLAQSMEHAATSPDPSTISPRPRLADHDRGVV